MAAPITPGYFKWLSLVVLIFQTTALVLTLRYSRTQKPTDGGPRYLPSTAVFISEIVKLITCFFVLFKNNDWDARRFLKEMETDVLAKGKISDALKLSIPAILYVVQNNLLFLALSKLDAATYQVTYQLKILTTAFFSVTMLHKKLNLIKWASLILLTAGVALVQLPKDYFTATPKEPIEVVPKAVENAHKSPTSHQYSSSEWDRLVGLIAIISACFSSGFAGVFLERILKTSGVSLWVRNLQLAFFSIFGAFLMTWLYDWEQVRAYGLLQGYNTIIWIVVLLQAYGGLVISLVVKYADNILKGFAVSLSILLSSFISWWFLADFEPTFIFVLGASIVIVSTFLYGYEPPRQPSQTGHSSHTA